MKPTKPKKKRRKNWKKTFRLFYDDNKYGGSSRWLVSPSTVENFIKSLL